MRCLGMMCSIQLARRESFPLIKRLFGSSPESVQTGWYISPSMAQSPNNQPMSNQRTHTPVYLTRNGELLTNGTQFLFQAQPISCFQTNLANIETADIAVNAEPG